MKKYYLSEKGIKIFSNLDYFLYCLHIQRCHILSIFSSKPIFLIFLKGDNRIRNFIHFCTFKKQLEKWIL